MRREIDKEKDECSCQFSVSESVEAGFSCFHLPPPVYPARFVVLTIQAIAKDKIHLMFGGNTKPFAAMFLTQGYSLKKREDANHKDPYPDFFYVKKTVDISGESERESLVDAICTKLVLKSPLFVRAPAEDGTRPALSSFVGKLKAVSSVCVEE